MNRNSRAPRRARKPVFVPRLAILEGRALLATLIVNPAGGPGVFTTIQAAVNAANPADTIAIDPATYTEQVTIDKSLTMEGTGAGVIIRAPSTLTPDAFGLGVLVEVGNAATVNISDLIISGPGPNPSAGTLLNDGILIVGGATANVTNTTVTQIQNPSVLGVQTGFGIQIGGSGAQAVGQVGHATITDCTVTAYEKVGILVGRSGSTGTITGSTITGIGPTSVIAQNGIQIGPGSASGTVSDSTISGNHYTGQGGTPDPTSVSGVQATGILNFISSTSIAGNTIVDNDAGIDSTNSTTAAAGSAVDASPVLGASNGSAAASITGNTLRGNLFENLVIRQGTTVVTGNTITGSNIGVAVVANAGASADAVGTFVSNDITDNGNVSVGFNGGGIRLLVQQGATTTPGATANFNRIVGNLVGLDNTTAPSVAVDATLNWWGSNTGPNTTGNDKVFGSAVSTSPWLVLGISASHATVGPGGTASVTASVTGDSGGGSHPTAPFFPDGIPITFGATGGTIAPASALTLSGTASSTITGITPGAATASAKLDNQTVTTALTVEPIIVTPPPTPQQTTAGRPFSQSFTVAGGAGGFVYTVSAGQLPPGLALDPTTGVVSGTTTTPGTFTFVVKATDVSGASVTEDLTTVVNPPVMITPNTPPAGTVGAAYVDQLTATGGTGAITFGLVPGTALPPGLSLSSNGQIIGTPTVAGTFTFAVMATDQKGSVAALPLSITVNPAVAIVPNTPPPATVGAAYADQLVATGGTGAITFAIAPGTALPPGLSLSTTGLISGTPTTAGTFPFAVTAVDQNGSTAAIPLSITVVPVQVAAPVVESLRRFGFHAQPTILDLTFSAALDAISAENLANYRIVLLNRLGRPVRGHAIPVRQAIYSAGGHSVTLVPAQRLDIHYHYQLTVNGSTPTGVRGASGLLIDGKGNGQPGSDYVATIDRSTLAGPDPYYLTRAARATAGRPEPAAAVSAAALERLAASEELAALARRRGH